MSLKDQLMKAGLANAKQARKAEHAKRQDAKDPAAETGKALAQKAQAEKAEKDRELARQQAEEKARRELAAQVKQIIETHRISRQGGEASYQFTAEKKIKKILCTAVQQDQVIRGVLAVARLGDSFELVPAVIAEKVQQRDPAAIVVLNTKSETVVDEDDPYKDYVIPDDLMW